MKILLHWMDFPSVKNEYENVQFTVCLKARELCVGFINKLITEMPDKVWVQ